jgi:replicative DNA helicase
MSEVYERTILGACLLEDEATLDLMCSVLRPEHFGLDSHQRIFRRIGNLHKAEKPVNIITVIQALGDEVEGVGGAAYVSDLTTGMPVRMGDKELHHYFNQLKESWRLRQLEALGDEMARRASGGAMTASELTQRAAERLEAITVDSSREDASIAASMIGSLDRFHELRTMGRSSGLSFGIATLDRAAGGMMPGRQTALGGGSGSGKTTFAVQAIHAALESGVPVDFFSLEATKDEVTWRLLSLISGVPYRYVTEPWTCNASDADKLTRAASHLLEMPLRLHTKAAMPLDEIMALARLSIHRYGTRLIVLDYIQRVQVPGEKEVRLKIAKASTALADLVKGTQAHSLLLSQITSGRKNGANSIPTMYDFRESSQIENDAHTIILLHRNYDERQGHLTNEGVALVPKMRFGSPCNVKLRFDPVTAAWTDWSARDGHPQKNGRKEKVP